MDDGYERWGSGDPVSPVIVSVPHPGRDYPAELVAALRVPVAALAGLEDRYIDHVAAAARGAETMLVQRRGRAWIDLNRAETERDQRVDAGAVTHRQPSVKVRSGLGLVPRRVAGAGDLWRRRFSGEEIEARIAGDHRPYHAAIDALLAAARARFGVAILLDFHSMPPLGGGHSMPPLGVGAAQMVVGDRHGRACAPRFVARLVREAGVAGIPCAVNDPYAGGHIVERHGRPSRNIHAVQLELDRTLYLDAALDGIGPGLATTATLVRRIIAALVDEAMAPPLALAAE